MGRTSFRLAGRSTRDSACCSDGAVCHSNEPRRRLGRAFGNYAEFGRPCWIEAAPLLVQHAGTTSVLVTGRQHSRRICGSQVGGTVTRRQDRLLRRRHSGSVIPISRIARDGGPPSERSVL